MNTNIHTSKSDKKRTCKLRPFNDELIKRIPNDLYVNCVLDEEENGLRHQMGKIAPHDRDAIYSAYRLKLWNDSVETQDHIQKYGQITSNMQIILAITSIADYWNGLACNHTIDFRNAMENLIKDYKQNPNAYASTITIRKCDKKKYNHRKSLLYERRWWCAMPQKERSRIVAGCVWMASDHTLDDRWTSAEQNVIILEMSYILVGAPFCNFIKQLSTTIFTHRKCITNPKKN